MAIVNAATANVAVADPDFRSLIIECAHLTLNLLHSRPRPAKLLKIGVVMSTHCVRHAESHSQSKVSFLCPQNIPLRLRTPDGENFSIQLHLSSRWRCLLCHFAAGFAGPMRLESLDSRLECLSLSDQEAVGRDSCASCYLSPPPHQLTSFVQATERAKKREREGGVSEHGDVSLHSLPGTEVAARAPPPLQGANAPVCGLQKPREARLLLRHDIALFLDRLRNTAAVQTSVESRNRLQARVHGRHNEGSSWSGLKIAPSS